jgi:hypothetical protein
MGLSFARLFLPRVVIRGSPAFSRMARNDDAKNLHAINSFEKRMIVIALI